jgi:hypothetical protein
MSYYRRSKFLQDKAIEAARWFGQQDAAQGQPCTAERYFTGADVQDAYREGFEAALEVAPLAPSLAEWAMGSPEGSQAHFQGTPMTDEEIAAEAADYEEDMLDRQWHSRGMW